VRQLRIILLIVNMLATKEKVKIKPRIIKEGKVAFTGSIPGENLVAQPDARLSDNAKGLGNIAEEIAKNKAQN